MPLTMRAMRLPEPQECVQPRVPWPVLRNRFFGLLRPMIGTLLGAVQVAVVAVEFGGEPHASRTADNGLSMTVTTLAAARSARMVLACAAALGGASAAAQEELDNQWHGDISIGGAFASGNSASRALTAKADVAKANPLDKITLFGLLNYARSAVDGVDTTTANRLALGGRYDHNLTAAAFVFGGVDAETNRASGLRSRYGVSAGAGYKLLRTESSSWDLFAGVGHAIVTDTDGSRAQGAELQLAEESSHEINPSTTVKQRFVFRPGTGRLGKLATFDASLATDITEGWTLNAGLSIRYDSNPAEGLKSTDTLLTLGFGHKF
jgi:putative salt-induced outer membrane protein